MPIIVPEELRDAPEECLLATLEVMYHVARSDGELSTEELAHFLGVASIISGTKISAAKLAIVVDGWEKRTDFSVRERFCQLREVLSTPQQRELACNLAAQLAEADDSVLKPEQKMLDLLGETFFG